MLIKTSRVERTSRGAGYNSRVSITHAGGRMYAVVFKADGAPVCVRMEGVSPDPVVTWTSEAAAREFIDAKGMAADFEPTPVDEASLERMAKALGVAAERMTLEPYPG
jgi:hypothetical protein